MNEVDSAGAAATGASSTILAADAPGRNHRYGRGARIAELDREELDLQQRAAANDDGEPPAAPDR